MDWNTIKEKRLEEMDREEFLAWHYSHTDAYHLLRKLSLDKAKEGVVRFSLEDLEKEYEKARSGRKPVLPQLPPSCYRHYRKLLESCYSLWRLFLNDTRPGKSGTR